MYCIVTFLLDSVILTIFPSPPPPPLTFPVCYVPGGSYKEQFVDTLMKTYTSEAVFLLTTFVNMARARPADSLPERSFIEMITLEIFEVRTCTSTCSV